MAIGTAGSILAIDDDAGTDLGVLFNVEATTGNRTVVSDFDDPNQGPLGLTPTGVAVVPAVEPSPSPSQSLSPSPTSPDVPGTNGGCSIAGSSAHLGTAMANLLIPLVPAFAIGLRVIRRRRKEGR